MPVHGTAYSSLQPASNMFQDFPSLSPSRLANFPITFMSQRRKHDFLHVIYFTVLCYYAVLVACKNNQTMGPVAFGSWGAVVKSGAARAPFPERVTEECFGEALRLLLGRLCPLWGAQGNVLRECSPLHGHSCPF